MFRKKPTCLGVATRHVLSWFLCRKNFENFGLNRESVAERAFAVSLRVSCPVVFLIGIFVSLDITAILALAIDQFIRVILIVFASSIGLYWAIYSSLNAEFVSKYQRLAHIHDEILPKVDDQFADRIFPQTLETIVPFSYMLNPEYLNFAEDCLIYAMEDSDSFHPTFQRIIALLYQIELVSPALAKSLISECPKLTQCFRTAVKNPTSKSQLLGMFTDMVSAQSTIDEFFLNDTKNTPTSAER